MPLILLARLWLSLMSWAVLLAGGYLLWSWCDGYWALDAYGVSHRLREPWQLWTALALLTWSLIWVAKDAEARGKSGPLLALLVFFTWPIGLLVWVVARPEPRRVPPPLPWPNPPPIPPPMPRQGMRHRDTTR